jgi:hypothetical protein
MLTITLSLIILILLIILLQYCYISRSIHLKYEQHVAVYYTEWDSPEGYKNDGYNPKLDKLYVEGTPGKSYRGKAYRRKFWNTRINSWKHFVNSCKNSDKDSDIYL